MAGQNPGDVFVDSIILSSPRTQSWNMARNFLSSTVNETIFTPGVTAEIRVIDPEDYLGKLKIAGDESIYFQYRKPDGAVAKYNFHLNSVKDIGTTGAMKAKTYTLDCVSREVLTGQAHYVQKAYNTQISDIIEDLFKQLNSKATVKVEPTKGKRNIKIANQPVLHAIEMLRKQAVSENNKSSNFLFWQTNSGFHFSTIEEALKQSPIKSFRQDNTVGHSMYSDFYSNILAFKVMQNMDAFNRIKNGALNQRVATFNVHTNEYKKADLKKKSSEMNALGAGLISAMDTFLQIFPGANRTTLRYIHANDKLDIDKTHLPEALPYKMLNLAQMQEQLVQLTVLGDPILEAGKVIICNIPKATSVTGMSQPETQVSGRWLIAKAQHVIGGPEQRPRFLTNLECIKGAYQEKVS
jgi:hypothetical protein